METSSPHKDVCITGVDDPHILAGVDKKVTDVGTFKGSVGCSNSPGWSAFMLISSGFLRVALAYSFDDNGRLGSL